MKRIFSTQVQTDTISWKGILGRICLVLIVILMFLFGIDLMVASFNLLGENTVNMIVRATMNPFTALFIGLLVTAIVQSSSATTSITVALVASGSISFESAIPLIMGANIGTTITSTFVSLGFINMKNEYKRAVAASTTHDFFNILTVCLLFPLEYYFKFLSTISRKIGENLFSGLGNEITLDRNISNDSWSDFLSDFLIKNIPNEYVLIGISFLLLLTSILLFRIIISNWLGVTKKYSKRNFRNPFYAFGWGLFSTAIIRSSTITTSLVVPLVAKKVVKLKSAFRFIMGANIGTTVTAFIAGLSNGHFAINIAIVHLLFNCIGVIVFLLPGVGELPIALAKGMGQLASRYRFSMVVYLLLVFFIIPFTLIFLNK